LLPIQLARGMYIVRVQTATKKYWSKLTVQLKTFKICPEADTKKFQCRLFLCSHIIKMIAKKIKVLGISGSLRPGSSSSCVLRIVANLFPDDIEFNILNGLEKIPAFDDSHDPPAAVKKFIRQISDSDGVFFCIPEYAFGVPGLLKNALDWTVSSTAFSFKPVALITAASSGEKAHASMLLTLSALGAKISERSALLISFIRTRLNEKNEIKDIETLAAIKKLIDEFIMTIRTNTMSRIENDI